MASRSVAERDRGHRRFVAAAKIAMLESSYFGCNVHPKLAIKPLASEFVHGLCRARTQSEPIGHELRVHFLTHRNNTHNLSQHFS